MAETVLVLRFRDLAPATPGHTIQAHRDVIKASGYVWWAWWKKQSESIPVLLWDEVTGQIRDNGSARVYLLDSGQRKLYRARLKEISAALGQGLTRAPESGAKTPGYYSDQEFATWFRLEGIEDASIEELRQFAFRDAPHDDIVSFNRREFENRVVSGISQLLEFGNVTYWVLTPKADKSKPPTDLPVRSRIPPPIAPGDILRAEHPRILHISDLHYGSKHAFAVVGDNHNTSMASAIYAAVQQTLPGIVVVTGDLTWTGTAEEFDQAFTGLDQLRAMLGLNRSDFVIVPGNHDLRWSRKKGPYRKDGRVEVASAEAKQNYINFFQKWYATEADQSLAIGRRYFLVGGPTVDVIGVSSSELQQIKDEFAGIGRVTEPTLNRVTEEMGWNAERRPTQLRILATHHHVLPVIAVEEASSAKHGFGIALDAASQLSLASRLRVDLILHGHQHQPFASFTAPQSVHSPLPDDHGILVVGSGSAGVQDEDLGPIGQRTFNVLDLDGQGVRLSVYGTPAQRDKFAVVWSLRATYSQPWKRPRLEGQAT